jgi:OTT_1508-like deaminase
VIRHLNDFTLTGIHIFYLDHGIRFQLRRWALKIMSFVISANRLFILTQSHRLRKIIDGNFSIQVLSSATTTPYRCHLSSGTIQAALNAAVAETGHPSDWDNKCEWFIEQVLGKLQEPIDVDHSTPMVHAELAMIIAMVKGEIKDVLPYIGVSKLSCTMCSHYIGAFNQVCKQNIVTKGSNGKAYPGWFWSSFPDRDEELRQTFLGRVRRQLLSDFEAYVVRRLSDSSVGSGGPEVKIGTSDEIDEWVAEFVLSHELL